VGAAASGATTVFIPVATPGIGTAGHLFRVDGVVLMPLRRVRADTLVGVDEVILRISVALRALRTGVTA
jgi:formylmethanofuran dehydrogenase subunit B